MKLIRHIMMAGAMLMAAPALLPSTASAQDFPLVAGDFTNISGIFVQDGGTLEYAKFLADQWTKQQEFAKSKGWISDYKIFVNVDARDGEPNIYLMETYRAVPTGAESEKRNKEWEAWWKKSTAQLEAESGNRAKFRTQRGTMLLQEYTVRK